MLEIRKPKII